MKSTPLLAPNNTGASAVNNLSTAARSTGTPLFEARRHVAGRIMGSATIPNKDTKKSHKLAIYKTRAILRK